MKKATFWISFLYLEIQFSDSKDKTISKERNSPVSQKYSENRDNFFSVVNSSQNHWKLTTTQCWFNRCQDFFSRAVIDRVTVLHAPRMNGGAFMLRNYQNVGVSLAAHFRSHDHEVLCVWSPCSWGLTNKSVTSPFFNVLPGRSGRAG